MMDLKECYRKFGGDYEDVRKRLVKEDLISRMVVKFLADPSYQNLCDALAEKNYGEAFRAVHTLKGLSLNFSFGSLNISSSNLTELLRHWETVPVDPAMCEQLFSQVSDDYNSVTAAIREFADKKAHSA